MSNDRKRAALDFGDDVDSPSLPQPASLDLEAIKLASRSAGFRETPKAAAPEPIASEGRPRRARRKTGRTEQFATRLKAETLEKIYGYADKNEITLAETIERSIAALEQIDS